LPLTRVFPARVLIIIPDRNIQYSTRKERLYG